jgi:poly(A) polymerase Pap1
MAGIVVPIIQDPPFVAIVKEPINTKNPKPSEISSNDALMKVMLAEDLIPSEEESAGRVKALGKLNELVASFVREAFAKNGHPDQYNEATSFRLRTFGSYRLDVHLPGADMDTVMLVPKHVLRSDMFMILYPMMSRDKDIKNLIKVEEARVPVIKFEMDGFEFDLAMSRFAGLSSLPEDFDGRQPEKSGNKCCLLRTRPENETTSPLDNTKLLESLLPKNFCSNGRSIPEAHRRRRH